MSIVCDTSPISYLVLIGADEVLPALYDGIVIPGAVRRELGHPNGPEEVRRWIDTPPAWLETREIRPLDEEWREPLSHGDPDVENRGPTQRRGATEWSRLDDGEQETILLAEQDDSPLVIIDERAGRAVARQWGLNVTGTIGVLGAAAQNGHVNAARIVEKLQQTTFRASPDLYRWLLSKQQ